MEFPIRRQVQIGVIAVTFCVFFIVSILILISSFIVLNILYIDMTSNVESQEANNIAEIITYSELKINQAMDFSKVSNQLVRNYIKNFEKYNIPNNYKDNSKNIDFENDKTLRIISIDNPQSIIKYNNDFKGDTEQNDNQITIIKLGKKNVFENKDNDSFEAFVKYKKSLSVLRNIIETRLYNLKERIISKIKISAINEGLIIYYPASRININFNLNEYYKRLFGYFYISNGMVFANYYLSKNQIFTKNNDDQYFNHVEKNPHIQYFLEENPIKELQVNIFNSLVFNISPSTKQFETVALNFNKNPELDGKNHTEILQHYAKNNNIYFKDLQMVVSSMWNEVNMEMIVLQIKELFKRAYVMFTNRDNNNILTMNTCYLLMKYFEIKNNLESESDSIIDKINKGDLPLPVYFEDCILYPNGKMLFNKDFNKEYDSIKRTTIVPIINELTDNKGKQYIFPLKDLTTEELEYYKKPVLLDNNFNYTHPMSDQYVLDFKNLKFTLKKTSKRFKHKIYRVVTPSKSLQLLYPSRLAINYNMHLTLIYEQTLVETHFSLLNNVYNIIYLTIITYHYVIWLILFAIIGFNLGKVTDDITTPIQDLTKSIKFLNSGNEGIKDVSKDIEEKIVEEEKKYEKAENNDEIEKNDEKEANENKIENENENKKEESTDIQIKKSNTGIKNINKINFDDDTDINNFFQKCKSLIKGGFNDYKNNLNQEKITKIYDSVTNLIKFNNFIIQDNYIMTNYTTKAAIIFTYEDKENEKMELNDDNTHTITQNNNNNNSTVFNDKGVGIKFKPIATNANDSNSEDHSQSMSISKIKIKPNKFAFKVKDDHIFEPDGYYSFSEILSNSTLNEIITIVRLRRKEIENLNPKNKTTHTLLSELYSKYTNNGEDLKKNYKKA